MKVTVTKRVENLENRMDSIESKLDMLLELQTSSKKKSAPNKNTKKSEKKSEEKKTRAEELTKKYGDIETRKAFVALKDQYAVEFKSLGKATGKYIKRNKFADVLREAAKTGSFDQMVAFRLHCEYAR